MLPAEYRPATHAVIIGTNTECPAGPYRKTRPTSVMLRLLSATAHEQADVRITLGQEDALSSGTCGRRHHLKLRGGSGLGCRLFYLEKIPFLTLPSWPKKLVVPEGFDLKRNPEAFAADHLMVTGLMNSWPDEPGGLVTAERPVAGPSQRMSKETVAATDTGFWRWNRALGILKKSLTCRSVAVIRALPSSRSTLTPPWPSSSSRRDPSGTVQNKPPGYGWIPGSKSCTWVEKFVKSN